MKSRLIAAALAATAVICAGGGGEGPGGGSSPGSFDLEIVGSASAGMVVLKITGPSAPTSVSPVGGYQLAWTALGDTAVRVVVYGGSANVIGRLATINVADRAAIPRYTVSIEEIAGNSPPYGQLSASALTPIQPQ